MTCPLCCAEVRRAWAEYVHLLEGRDGAGDGEEDHVVGRQQKKWRRDGMWKRRGMEKSKNDFPTPLGNPANPRDSHFPTASATAGDSLKPDISFATKSSRHGPH